MWIIVIPDTPPNTPHNFVSPLKKITHEGQFIPSISTSMWPCLGTRLTHQYPQGHSLHAELLTGLILYRSYTDSHSYCELMRVPILSCPKDTALPDPWVFLIPLLWWSLCLVECMCLIQMCHVWLNMPQILPLST